MYIQKRYVALAAGSALGVASYVAHAADFNASGTLVNTLEVTVVEDFDIGTVFATGTTGSAANGVSSLVIDPTTGVATAGSGGGVVTLTSLTDPTPGQGSVAINNDFTLTFPDTSGITTANLVSTSTNITAGGTNQESVELQHESNSPEVASLYLMHFTVESPDGDVTITEGSTHNGVFTIDAPFGTEEFVFTFGGTITTAPNGTELPYETGTYSGTFEVTAEY